MGYGELKVKQQEAIIDFMTGRDVFVALPRKAIRLHKKLQIAELLSQNFSKVVVHCLWSSALINTANTPFVCEKW